MSDAFRITVVLNVFGFTTAYAIGIAFLSCPQFLPVVKRSDTQYRNKRSANDKLEILEIIFYIILADYKIGDIWHTICSHIMTEGSEGLL